MPLLCLLDGKDRLMTLVSVVPPWTEVLMESFWPGPLTIVFPPREGLPPPILGPTGGVAVRWSSHPVAQALVRHLGAPVVGTSANLSGEPPCVRVEELPTRIQRGVGGILDGGPTPGGQPSTVLDCTAWPGTVVRVGSISVGALEIATGLTFRVAYPGDCGN